MPGFFDESAEKDELRRLVVEAQQRIDALQDMIGTPIDDEAAYKAAFRRLLELLPEDSGLKVTSIGGRQITSD